MAFLVEKHLERKSQRRPRAHHAQNLSRQPRRVGQILAVQFVIDLEHVPSQRPIDLPLHFRFAAEDRLLAAKPASARAARALFASEFDRAALGVIGRHRALDDLPALGTNRHERRPSGAIFLAQRRRDYRDYLRVLLEDQFEAFVKAPRGIHLGRAHQFVLDFDRRQESAEQADHMIGKTRAAAEGVGDLRDRDAQVLLSGLAIGHVLRHFAQPVEIVDENDQARRPRRLDQMKRLAHERRPQNFRHRAEMRQARRPEAALEDHRPRRLIGCDALRQPPSFLARPQFRGRARFRFSCARHRVIPLPNLQAYRDFCRGARSRPPRESTDRSGGRDFFPRRAAV